MGLLLYRASIVIYTIAIRLAALFHPKARLFINGRKNLFAAYKHHFDRNTSPVVWVHCASLGEFEQGRPIIEAFKKDFPDYKVLLTFFSPSGYEVRKNYKGADTVLYLPTDTKKNAQRLITIVKPKIAIFIKYEFWYYYTRILKEHNIPLLSASSIFRDDQLFFKPLGKFYRNTLYHFDYFFVQHARSKELLSTIGIENVEVVGDTRFDRVWEVCNNSKDIPQALDFKNGQKLIVVGSCWPEDMEILTPFIHDSTFKFIIAPHEIDEKKIAKIEKDLSQESIRFSKIMDQDVSKYRVMIVDNVGMLSSLYKYGEYAYVGGGFGNGLHNILEPATYGIPIFFGNKNYMKFNEAVDLINLGGAAAVGSYDAFINQFRAFENEKTYMIARQINKDYILDNIGATSKIMKYCTNRLN